MHVNIKVLWEITTISIQLISRPYATHGKIRTDHWHNFKLFCKDFTKHACTKLITNQSNNITVNFPSPPPPPQLLRKFQSFLWGKNIYFLELHIVMKSCCLCFKWVIWCYITTGRTSRDIRDNWSRFYGHEWKTRSQACGWRHQVWWGILSVSDLL